MKKRHYIYAFFSFLLLLGVLGGTYFFYKQIVIVKEFTMQKQNEWQVEENRRNEIKNLERSVKNLAQEKKELDSHFVSSDDPVDFLNNLELMASSVGALAEVNTVGTVENNSTLIINLKVNGSFDSLFRFLTLLENSFYIIEVQSLSLNTAISEVKNLNPKWDMNLQVKLITFSTI